VRSIQIAFFFFFENLKLELALNYLYRDDILICTMHTKVTKVPALYFQKEQIYMYTLLYTSNKILEMTFWKLTWNIHNFIGQNLVNLFTFVIFTKL